MQYDRNTTMSDTRMVPVGGEDEADSGYNMHMRSYRDEEHSDDESGTTGTIANSSRKRPAPGRLDDRKVVSGVRITDNVNRCLTAIARTNAKNEELSSEIMREREENAELKVAVEKAEAELSDPALVDAIEKLEDLLVSMGF